MTVLTMRREHGEFVVAGPDIEPVKFRTRREPRDWCARHIPVHRSRRSRPTHPINRPGARSRSGVSPERTGPV